MDKAGRRSFRVRRTYCRGRGIDDTESRVMMGAPGWLQNAMGQAGITLSWALIDEWTKIETMGKKTGASTTINAKGWYSEEAVERCAAAGIRAGLEPELGREG